MGRRDEAAGLHERLEHDRLAVRLARRLAEHEPLAGDRVLDDVSCVDHLLAPFVDLMLGAPPGNTCRLLARDHTAPEPTLLLTKVFRPWLVRVRPLAWC